MVKVFIMVLLTTVLDDVLIVSDGIIGIKDVSSVVLYFTYIKCSAITSLSNTAGKLNVLNDTVFHAS